MNSKTSKADYDARGYLTEAAMRRLVGSGHTIFHHPPDSTTTQVIGLTEQVPAIEALAAGDPAAEAAALAELRRQHAAISERLAALEDRSVSLVGLTPAVPPDADTGEESDSVSPARARTHRVPKSDAAGAALEPAGAVADTADEKP